MTTISNEKHRERKSLARGGMLSFVGSASSAVLGFVLTIIITRLMGAEGAGVVFQATGVFAVVMAFAKFGLDSTAVYLVPRLLIDDPRRVRQAVWAFVLLATAVSAVSVLVLELVASLVWGEGNPEVLRAIRAVAVFIPFGALLLIVSAVLRALGSVREYVLVSNIGVPVLRPPFVAVAAVATGSAVMVSLAWALPQALLLAAAGALVSRHIRRVEAGERGPSLPEREQWAQIWKFAVPRTMSAGLEQALIWIDVLLIGWLLSDHAAGIYGGAARFVQAGLLFDAALRVVVSPRFSSLLHQRKTGEVRELYVTASVWLVLIATPAYVVLSAFAPLFLGLLGPEFVGGAWVLIILSSGMAITFLAGNIHSLLIMSGRSGWAAFNKLVVLAVNVGANLVLIPRMGIEGAAVAWSLCMLLDAALAAIEVRVFLGIQISLLQVLRPLLLVLIAFGVPSLAALWAVGPTLGALLAASAVGLAAYGTSCWWLRTQLRLDGLAAMIRSRR